MLQLVEVAWDSLSKHGEELCGDWIKVTSTDDTLSIVLSDGLGSGVKVNILSTLTAEIASKMFERGATVDQVIETLCGFASCERLRSSPDRPAAESWIDWQLKSSCLPRVSRPSVAAPRRR